MKTCKLCFYNSNHPLGLTIDSDGVCSGCRTHQEKDTINWNERWLELVSLVSPYKSKDGSNYDCIIPVTGSADSFYIVHVVKERLGMNPLLVTYNKYYNTPVGTRNLARLRIRFNCDLLIKNINPVSVKKVAKTTLRRFGSFHWHAIAGQTVFPVQTALSHKIPLIIWGAHQGIEQVGMFSHLDNVEMTRRYRKEHDLMGYEADDLLGLFDMLSEEDVWQFRYPDQEDLANAGVRGIYLSNYLRWDPLKQHQQMVDLGGYRPAKMNRTFDVFENTDDWHYMDTHDWIKYIKHGYGKVTDHVTREIRHKRCSRAAGFYLIAKYQDKQPENTMNLLEWLGIDAVSFSFILRVIRERMSRHNEYRMLSQAKDASLSIPVDTDIFLSEFKAATELDMQLGKNRVINIGKGYPD